MKLLRTIRLDPSDTYVFEHAAEPGEWAVSGTFMFAREDPRRLQGKARSAFRSGFLGVHSLGWSTLVQIVEATHEQRAEAVSSLAQKLVAQFCAPDLAAQEAAREEIDFASSLCSHPPDTLIAVHRRFEQDAIREAFRSLQPKGAPKPLRAFAFLEIEGEEEPGEELDLVEMVEGQKHERP
jgi:hypothetical protein